MQTINTISSKLCETASLLKRHSTLAEVMEYLGAISTPELQKPDAKSNVVSLSQYSSIQKTKPTFL